MPPPPDPALAGTVPAGLRSSSARAALGAGGGASSALVVALVVASYALGAELAWGLFGASLGLAFFPPAGVTVAALCLSPVRRWPWLLAAIGTTELVVDVRHGLSAGVGAGYAAANMVEPLVGVLVLRRALAAGAGDPVDLSVRHTFRRFLVATVLIGPAAGGLVGASVKEWETPTSDWLVNFVHFVAGDGLGVLVVATPILLLRHRRSLDAFRPWSASASLLLLTAAVSVTVFWAIEEPLMYVVLPLLLWAAFRSGVHGVAVHGAVVAGVANVATAHGHGPFAAVTDVSSQVQLGLTKLFLGVSLLAAWYFALEVGERARADEARQAARQARRVAERDRAVAVLAAALAGSEDVAAVHRTVEGQLRAHQAADVVTLLGGGAVWPAEGSRAPGDLVPTVPGSAVARFVERTGDDTSVAVLPLTGTSDGVLVAQWRSVRTFDEIDRSYLASAAHITAQALARARAGEAERASAERVRDLQRLTVALAGADDPTQVAQVLADAAVAWLGAGAVCVVADGGPGNDATVLASRGDADAVLVPLCRLTRTASPVADAFATGAPVLVADAAARAARYAAWAAAIPDPERSSWAVVPFGQGGERCALVLGLTRPTSFPPEERAFLDTVAEQAGQALLRAALRAAEHDAAVRLQENLLAHTLDRVAGARVEARYRPAASTVRVGGDWHDAVATADGRLLATVGDVVGRGLQAALTMSDIRSGARALAARSGPAELLVGLDRLARTVDGALCTTMVCILLDPATGVARYAAAGHPHPLVRRADGTVALLCGGRSSPLGTHGDAPRPEEVVTLAPGDLVLLYTDGLVERPGEVIDRGLDRLLAAAAGADVDCPGWLDVLVDRCLEGTPARDDLAVLALRRVSEGRA